MCDRAPFRLFPVLCFALIAALARADIPLPGYASRAAGEVFEYHSPDVNVTKGLLARCVDGRPIEWDTAAVPQDLAGQQFVSFVWLFALQVNAAERTFAMSVNGEHWLDIRTRPAAEPRDWTVAGAHGSSLRFRATMVDRFGDLMGYAMLRVPAAELTPGKPLRIRVTGEAAGSRSWYITYQAPVTARADLQAPPAIVHSSDGDYRPIQLTVVHLGEPIQVDLQPSFGPSITRTLEFGVNRFEFRHPEHTDERTITVAIHRRSSNETSAPTNLGDSVSARITPVRHWAVNLVQHAHTDIGYSRPQTDILAEHVRFIDTALDACDATDDLPDDAKFRWTCETSWAVAEYLRARTPEQGARLRKRCQEGRIECTGMYLNMSEIIDEPSYVDFLRPIADLRGAGIPVSTAMQDDVNGVAWCLADMLPQCAVKYLVMGQHGHRALVPFSLPTCFWWQAPSGSRILAFRADHYHTGNFWEVHSGQVDRVQDELLRYLEKLERSDYPFDHVAVQHSGYHTDNSPPSIAASRLARDWNQKYAWPHLRCALVHEFPEWVEQHHAADVPTFPLAWTDWWTDGFGSAARESAVARITQGRVAADEAVLAMLTLAGHPAPAGAMTDLAEVRKNLLFWAEHTLGAAESIRQPLAEESQSQWAMKQAYAWTAAKGEAQLRESVLGQLQALAPSADTPRLLVVNTLGFPRSGLVEINADHEVLPPDGRWRLVDDAGAALPVQKLGTRMDGSTWAVWCPDVPAFGYREFRVESLSEARAPAPIGELSMVGPTLENQWYQLRIDPVTGALGSIIEKASGAELIDQSSEWKLGQVIHESLGNREQLEGFMLESVKRTPMSDPTVEAVTSGPLWDTITVRGELPGCAGPGGVRCEVRLYHTDKRLELRYTIQKRRVYEPEGLYVAFPFAGPEGQVRYETLGATVTPATDIFPGAATDWQTMQSFASVHWPASNGGPERRATLSSNEAPLIQVGGFNLGKFQRRMRVDKPTILSWVMNNYWTTNFCPWQEGEFTFSYSLTSGQNEPGADERFGQSVRVPLLGRIMRGGGPSRPTARRSLLGPFPSNLALLAARPSREQPGVVLQLREVEGITTTLPFANWIPGSSPVRAREVDPLGQPVSGNALLSQLSVPPHGVKFLLVETNAVHR